MNEDNIVVQGLGFEISEDKSNPDYLQGRFCVCDFDINGNNVSLNRDTIDEWVSTLVGTPLVAKITKDIKGKEDFGSHEMRIISFKDKAGNVHKKAVFDTSAFGVCTNVSIETADDGNDYIYADYKIWKRFENACKIVKERADTLKTSWEICTEEFSQKIKDGKVIKRIDKGRFIGLAMLAKGVEPAYSSSGLLEVASEQEDELNIALMEDLQNLNISSNIKSENKEVIEMQDNIENVEQTVETSEVIETTETAMADTTETSTEVVETNDVAESQTNNNETETSALTERDFHNALLRAFEAPDSNGKCTYGYPFFIFPAENVAWFKEYGAKSELDLVEVKYAVENNQVKITERNPVTLTVSPREINQVIAQKDNAIVEMSAQIQSLNNKIAELQPYKDKVDEIEKAEREAQFEKDKKELSDYAISSGHITQEELETSEEIKGYIDNLDKTSIKSLIADRVVASLVNQIQKVETSEINAESGKETNNIQVNISAEQTDKKNTDCYAFDAIKAYLGR